MALCLRCCLLLLVLAPGWHLFSAEGDRISTHFANERMGSVSGLIGTVLDLDILPDASSLEGPGLWLTLHEAPIGAALQAMAHASDRWWWFEAAAWRYHLIARDAGMGAGTLSVRSYSSSMRNRHDLEVVVRQIMTPWLGRSGSGLASIPWTGQWTATLPPPGHEQLTQVLAALEQGQLMVPSPRPLRDIPSFAEADQHHNLPPVRSRRWAQVMIDQAQALQVSLSVSPSVAALPLAERAIELQVHSVAAFARHLRQQGFTAEWVDGVLCVDLAAIARRAHPLLSRRLIVLPIPQLTASHDGALISAGLQRATASIGWHEPERVCIFVANPDRLMIAVEENAVSMILDALDHFERHGRWRTSHE
ncbi:MAG: hypothetical protein EA402_05015 [Planctomycetota bacterium]|nr:MAG: hypothetical protein EA402_05015 [Planctomycetota bacterium]